MRTPPGRLRFWSAVPMMPLKTVTTTVRRLPTVTRTIVTRRSVSRIEPVVGLLRL